MNEPVSALQRLTAYMEYNDLLDKASEEMDSLKRLSYVVAHGIVCWTNVEFNTSKPFNPLLGETFEHVTDKFQLISE